MSIMLLYLLVIDGSIEQTIDALRMRNSSCLGIASMISLPWIASHLLRMLMLTRLLCGFWSAEEIGIKPILVLHLIA